MAKRKVHYENWNGGTEADTEPPSETFCGLDVADPLTAMRTQAVTCKYCLKLLEFLGHKVRAHAWDGLRTEPGYIDDNDELPEGAEPFYSEECF